MKAFMNVTKKVKETMVAINNDQTGGPGLEEAVLLVFVGLVVANAADTLGDTLSSSFTSATNSLKTQLGIN